MAEIAHAMVADYAMGTAQSGRVPDVDGQMSQMSLRIRDEERQELVEEARRAAQRLVAGHREHLDALATELLRTEVLERDAIDRILGDVPRVERRPAIGLRVAAAAAPQGLPPGPRTRNGHSRGRDAGRAGAHRASAPPRPDRPRAGAAGAAAIDSPAVFRRIDHIGVAVQELDGALPLWHDHFAMPVVHREVVTEQGVEAVLLDVGENHVELLSPLVPTPRSAAS